MILYYENLPGYSLLIIILPRIANLYLLAQKQKSEVEISIKEAEIPAPALNILNQFWNDKKKVDFYREFDGNSVSYEAKFMPDNHLLSIEFNERGLIKDIEQLIEFDEIPENTGNIIRSYLNDQYTKFKVTRIQRQYSGGDELTKSFLEEDLVPLTIRYELEVEAQNKEELGIFEFLFNKNGQFLWKCKIMRRSLDNIW
ncbi:MAG: hypothetical protein MK198_10215 [Gracilimonas sp.]|uniref:hypothetical protein n=1 Tax=Gracilimonas sp. TaxID=1974203 RepID=UPI003751193B|nr:hypothetical protein [Gracilimonas sp.]